MVDVVLNDQLDCSTLDLYDKVVLSPGPGLPVDSGALMEVIRLSDGIRPVFGVCLGMQAIAEYLGGTLYNQKQVKHGVCEIIQIESSLLFQGFPSQIEVGLYHSWAVNAEGDFEVISKSSKNIIMAIENKSKNFYGVQFHPESILTPRGKWVIKNFLNL